MLFLSVNYKAKELPRRHAAAVSGILDHASSTEATRSCERAVSGRPDGRKSDEFPNGHKRLGDDVTFMQIQSGY